MEDYQIEKLDESRERKRFSLFPFIIVNRLDEEQYSSLFPFTGFEWTGKWFKFVIVREQKVRERYLQFDDGWSYKYYWGHWIENWKFIRIVYPDYFYK
jgi:hypothetical protein